MDICSSLAVPGTPLGLNTCACFGEEPIKQAQKRHLQVCHGVAQLCPAGLAAGRGPTRLLGVILTQVLCSLHQVEYKRGHDERISGFKAQWRIPRAAPGQGWWTASE